MIIHKENLEERKGFEFVSKAKFTNIKKKFRNIKNFVGITKN